MSTLSSTPNKQIMTRTRHVCLSGVSSLQLAFHSWISEEQTMGANATITAAIEYPSGTFTQVTFSGAAQGTIPDGTFILSDAVSVTIPASAVFYVRSYYTNTAGICYHNNGCNTSLGESCTFAASGVVDQTMGGTITNTSGHIGYGPIAIIGWSSAPALLFLGDSRGMGVNDTATGSTSAVGELAPSFGDSYASSNMCISGATAQGLATAPTAQRVKLAPYFTHVLSQFGINDLTNSHTASTIISDLRTIQGLFPGKKFYQATIAPHTTSTDSWATTANQTVVASEAQRVSLNTTIRANASGFNGYVEVADQVESARNSGLWIAPSYTTDGLHESNTANVAIKNSGAINPAALL